MLSLSPGGYGLLLLGYDLVLSGWLCPHWPVWPAMSVGLGPVREAYTPCSLLIEIETHICTRGVSCSLKGFNKWGTCSVFEFSHCSGKNTRLLQANLSWLGRSIAKWEACLRFLEFWFVDRRAWLGRTYTHAEIHPAMIFGICVGTLKSCELK